VQWKSETPSFDEKAMQKLASDLTDMAKAGF
jgi:hypothetical protein